MLPKGFCSFLSFLTLACMQTPRLWTPLNIDPCRLPWSRVQRHFRFIITNYCLCLLFSSAFFIWHWFFFACVSLSVTNTTSCGSATIQANTAVVTTIFTGEKLCVCCFAHVCMCVHPWLWVLACVWTCMCMYACVHVCVCDLYRGVLWYIFKIFFLSLSLLWSKKGYCQSFLLEFCQRH